MTTTHTDLIAEAKLSRVNGTLSLVAQRRLYKLVLLLSDLLMLSLAFAVAYTFRFQIDLPVFRTEIAGDPMHYQSVVVLMIPLWIVIFWMAGLYHEHNLLGGTREYALAFNATSAGMFSLVVLTFLDPTFTIARGWVLLGWGLAFLFVAGARFWLRRGVYVLRRKGWYLSPALVVGTNEEAQALAGQLASWQTSGLNVLGCVSGNGYLIDERRVTRNLFVLGDLSDLSNLVRRYGIEEVVIATSALTRPELIDVFRRFGNRDDVHLRLSSGLFEILTTGLEVKELAYIPLINMRPVRLSGVDSVLKSLLDYGIAIPVAVLGAPIYIALAILVKLDSAGPIIHRRRVLGLGGSDFNAFKFRTMHVNGSEILAQHLAENPECRQELVDNHKIKDDPRVTRVGRWLRKFSLDELPQVYNVLLGQMSIVGPRMISPAEHEKYGKWDMNLLTVKPGITGLWQVSGRSDISYEERVRLDMNYIRNWTIWSDLYILLQTIPAVLRGRGAY